MEKLIKIHDFLQINPTRIAIFKPQTFAQFSILAILEGQRFAQFEIFKRQRFENLACFFNNADIGNHTFVHDDLATAR